MVPQPVPTDIRAFERTGYHRESADAIGALRDCVARFSGPLPCAATGRSANDRCMSGCSMLPRRRLNRYRRSHDSGDIGSANRRMQ